MVAGGEYAWVLPDTKLAISRLQGFKFIGLVEHWALSICLFHAMIGGECLPSEFVNTRPARPTSTFRESRNLFDDLLDPFDEPLYEKASDIFWGNVNKYNVSHTACKK